MKPSRCMAMVVVLSATLMAQTPANKTKTPPAGRSTAMAKDIQALHRWKPSANRWIN